LAAGEKIILPISPLLGAGRHPYRQTERKHHAHFPYPFREFDDIVISLHEGLAAEVRPAPYKIGNDFSAYSLASAEEAPEKLHIQRDLIVTKSYFPVDQYASIKSFYDTARTHDEAQIVLTKVQK